MFGFDKPEDGSEDRYTERLRLWEGIRGGALIHYAYWLLHNCVSHPLIGVLPVKPFFDFHDWTSHRMHGTTPAKPNSDVSNQGSR